MFCVNVEEMKKCDVFTIEKRGVPPLVLMENAAFEVFNFLSSRFTRSDRFIIFTGKGNNGGDGFAVARLLHTRGYDVTVCIMDATTSNDARWNARIAKKYDIPCKPHSMCNANAMSYTVAIDAVNGTGFTGLLESHIQTIFKRVNAHPTITRIAIDIPSGVEADTGHCSPNTFNAHYTITFEYPKYGHFLQPGKSFTGNLIVRPIGASGCMHKVMGEAMWFDEVRLSRPYYNVHKYSRGHVAVIGGCNEYSGAAVLASESALYAGAGYTAVYTTAHVETRLPEIVVHSLPSFSSYVLTQKDKDGVLIIGPGMGRSDDVRNFLKKLFLEYRGLTVLLDGDALFYFNDYYRPGIHTVLCTPHDGELTYMSGLSLEEIQKNRIEAGKKFTRDHQCFLVMKSESTIIFSPEGEVAFSPYGDPILATLGSGDVLAGTIAGIWASQAEISPYLAAQMSVCIQGKAAEELVKTGRFSATATTIQQEIRRLIEKKMI